MEFENKAFEQSEFHIRYEIEPYNCNFKVYSVSIQSNGQAVFHKKGATSYPTPEEDYWKAQIFLEGNIKWDGCSNWDFREMETGCIHFCNPEQSIDIGRLFERLYEIARQVIEDADF